MNNNFIDDIIKFEKFIESILKQSNFIIRK